MIGLLVGADIETAMRSGSDLRLVSRDVMRTEFPLARVDDLLTDVQQQMVDTDLPIAPVIDAGGNLIAMTMRDMAELYQMLAAQRRAWGLNTNRPATRP